MQTNHIMPGGPLESRRVAWRKALFNEFSEEELTESRRRTQFSIGILESHLAKHEYIAGPTYSLGDINAFNLAYALPFSQADHCNDEKTPRIMAWLRMIYARPATKETWAKGRTHMASRLKMLEPKS